MQKFISMGWKIKTLSCENIERKTPSFILTLLKIDMSSVAVVLVTVVFR